MFKQIGKAVSGVLGGRSNTSSSKSAARTLMAPFEYDRVQNLLPPYLRQKFIGGALSSGMQGIADLIERPGRLAGNVSDAIAPRLAIESERIARDFTGTRQNVAGSLARGNAPVSIKGALDAALRAQETSQQGDARRMALMDSDQLRRQDLGYTGDIINAINSFLAMRMGGQAQGASIRMGVTEQQQKTQAANLATISSLLSSMPSHLGKQPGPG